MRVSHFFIDRPIFACVVSIVFVILGAVAYARLPVAQYPEIAPPIINVTGQYPGADADVVAATVVAPIEEQINGVDNMLYVSSNSTADGRFTIAVSFELGTNLDIAQVQVQNRVAIAQPRLPADVRQVGVTVNKSSPDLMMVVHLYSPDKSRDTLFISNYATLEIKDQLLRIDGVGSITVFGSRDYAMRIWLDPTRLQSLGLTAADVTLALQGQNIQVASGVLNQPPTDRPGAFQVAVKTLGRLAQPEEFGSIVVKQTPSAVVRLRDVAKVELAALDYSSNSYLNLEPAVALAVFQRPGSNALSTAMAIRATMDQLAKHFPAGVTHTIIYDPTQFIAQSVEEVQTTIGQAILLVVIVVALFLQTWRAAIIPLVAIPISLIGTFFFMAIFGFTINNLTLFGLVLAVGIVVDDAIVVVENVERNIAAGLSPRQAAVKSMDEVGAALVAIALVLCAVFVPSGFITGISGQFYRQFALTITGATIISLLVSLTLSPALCALLLKPHVAGRSPLWRRPLDALFRGFDFGFAALARGYGWLAGRVVRFALLMLIAYAAIVIFGLDLFRRTPVGFIPPLDRGYLIAVIQLPPGASLTRTDEVNRRAVDIALRVPGVSSAVNVVGFNGATFTQAPNSGAIFVVLELVFRTGQGSAQIIGRHPGGAVQASRRHPGGGHLHRSAAARARHRQCRRISDDGRGSCRPRSAGAAGSGRNHDAPRRADSGSIPGLLVVRIGNARALSRHRPYQGADARHRRTRRLCRSANLHRLDLRERLQPVRPHLPRDRAGRKPVSARAQGRARDSRAQRERGHGAARLLHHGARHRRSLSRAAL